MKRLIAPLAILGAVLSRWHGGGFFPSPKAIKNIAYALPFGLVTGYAFYVSSENLTNILIASIAAFAFGMLKSTGHGRGFRLREPMKVGSEPERVEILIAWMCLPLYLHKVAIMTLTGLLPSLGAALAIGYINPLYGIIIALGGAFKGVNAMIFDLKTEYREFADGFTAYAGLAICFFPALV